MRLIDADALKDRLGIGGTKTSCRGCQYKFHWSVCDLEKVPSFVYVCTAIDEAPTIEAEPIHHSTRKDENGVMWILGKSGWERKEE